MRTTKEILAEVCEEKIEEYNDTAMLTNWLATIAMKQYAKEVIDAILADNSLIYAYMDGFSPEALYDYDKFTELKNNLP